MREETGGEMAGASAARVSDASALQDAIARRVLHIVAEGEISSMPMIAHLQPPGVSHGCTT
jgi:hypothetical protein